MKWLLDTNVLIHALRGEPRGVARRLQATSPDDLAISTVTIAELWYGAAKSRDPVGKRAAWKRVLAPLHVLSFDAAAAELHGDLRFSLRHAPIGERDLMIAAIALSQDLTVVSANVGEMSRVPGLEVADWSRGGTR